MASILSSSTSLRSNPSLPRIASFPRRNDSAAAAAVVSLPTVRVTAVLKYRGTQKREKQLTEMIEKKVMEAKQVCEGNAITDECKVAWDEVEEVSQAKADLRRKMEKEDPLESFCGDNPETDECRVYED